VVRTRVGYAGGHKKNPTYYSLGDHTETLQLDFDPTVTSYEKILDVFWKTPNSCQQGGSRQYMSAIFYEGEAQQKVALATRDRAAARLAREVHTPILPLTAFYLAEDYHQKYFLQQCPEIYRELRTIYPQEKDFMRSTAATRINAFLSGHGSRTMLEKEIASYGLSPAAAKILRERAGHGS
jgi:peptide-methionine (S)-S-oxide reductase